MASYKAPLRDMRFVLHELLGGADSGLECLEGFPAPISSIPSQEAAKIAKKCCIRSIAHGDEEGCSIGERRGADAERLQGSLHDVP